MPHNLVLDSDSYKYSHSKQYPPGTEYVYSYIESRGSEKLPGTDLEQYQETVFFGLNYYIQKYLTKPFTQADIDEAEEIVLAHGEPFNREGFEYILKEHAGYFPVRIRAVPEGRVVPTRNVLVDIENLDPKCFWVTSFLETAILRSVWYGTTVATREFEIRLAITKYLKETADPEALNYIGVKHNDFGSRGSSSHETSALGGLAHLAIFTGTDNVPALLAAKKYYGAQAVAGYSIPAAEHSTMTSWGGRDGEIESMRNMVKQFGKPGGLLAVVSDSYDIYNAVENYWGDKLLQEVKDSGATVVIRPDSGDPTVVPVEIIKTLMSKVGYTTNSKGYKVLPPYYRVIQGDGMNEKSIVQLLYNLKDAGLSTDNIAVGMGGGMLQQVNRDTLKFAMKCSAIKVNGEWRDVFKDPITDHGKISKKGRLSLLSEKGKLTTIRQEEFGAWDHRKVNILEDVYVKEIGKLPVIRKTTLDQVRENVETAVQVRI